MVTKPTPGATGWNVAVDEVIDIANSVADLPTRVAALEGAGGDVTEAELAAGLATKAAAVHNHAEFITQDNGDNRYILQTVADTFAPAEATTTALAGKQSLDADLTALAGLDSATAGTVASDGAGWVKKTYAQLRTALGLTTIATSGKLVDATDVITTGAAVGQLLVPTGVSGGAVTAWGLRRRARGALAPLRSALDSGTSVGVQVLGDSTGATATRWPYLLGQALGTRYPAYTALHQLWNDTSQAYDAVTTLQTGAGGERYLAPGSQGAFVEASQITPGTDLDVRVKVSFNAWPVAANTVLMCRGYQAGQYSFRFITQASGQISLRYSLDGATNTFSPAVTLSGITANTPVWLRFTYTANDGSGNRLLSFYQSSDGIAWTQVGATGTTAGAGSLFNSTDDWELGAEGFNGSVLAGKIYRADVLNAIGGRPVSPLLMDGWKLRSPATATRGGAPVLLIVNGSKSGADITYLNDSVRAPKMLPNASQAVCIMSSSHNDGTRVAAPYMAQWDTLLTRVRAALPASCLPVVTTQNPEIAPAVFRDEHATRQWQLPNWAARNAVDLVDAYQAFLDDGRALSVLLEADGVHPSDAAGSPLWRDAMLASAGLIA